MSIRKNIPNILTSLNLITGLLGIIAVADHQLKIAAWLVLIAVVFDFFDGMTARILNARSDIGKQLDSLADLVSFGVLPGMILFELIRITSIFETGPSILLNWIPYFALFVPVCSAWRLAKFNIDERQKDSFLGLPTPANALLFASIPLFLDSHIGLISSHWLDKGFTNMWFLAGLAIVSSFLLVSEIPLMALKFKSLTWKENGYQYILIALSVILILLAGFHAYPFILFIYFLVSVAKHILAK